MSQQFRLEGDLRKNLIGMPAKQKAAIIAAARYTAPIAQSYMQTNAKWIDRTGNARNGLRARVVVESTKVSIVMYHSVPYGVWLEVRWGGKYSILMPALHAVSPMFMQAIKRLMFEE